MKYIIFEQQNKKLGIIFPANVDMSIDEIAKTSLPPNTNYAIVENLILDVYFIDAYEYVKGEAVINYEKAKEIQKNKWREARKPLLDKLDIAFMKALEIGDLHSQKQISEKKQALRNITNTVMIDNLDMIKSTWPNILTEE